MGWGRPKGRAKVRSLAQATAERDMKQYAHDALMALVRREGRVRITILELRALKAGAGLSIEASGDGLLLTYVEPGEAPKAG